MARTDSYDVVVAGGGSAGVAAAVGAAGAGARVLLVEGYGFLGGAATHSLVLAWCGFWPQRPPPRRPRLVHGAADIVLDHLASLGHDVEPYYSPSGNWNIRLNPEATKIALDRTVARPGIDLRVHTRIVGATVAGGRIAAIRIADHAGVREVEAAAFVDATGDGDLAFLAGAAPCPLHAGGHGQPASYPVRIGGIPRGVALEKAARAAAMSRIERRLGRAELRADGGTMTTLPGTDDVWWLAIEVATNGLDGADLAAAERDGRALVWRGVAALARYVPGFEHANVAATGPNIGIRETRHTRAIAPVREAVLAAGRMPEDTIAIGGWPMEIHAGPGRVEYRPIGGEGAFGIGAGAIRSADLANLWLGGRTIGADPAAYASVRVMGTAFGTGHAAGVGAALQAAGGSAPDAATLRAELGRQQAW